MRKILLFIFLICISSNLYSQQFSVGFKKAGFETVANTDWGTDVIVSNAEPLGKPSAIARPNGTVYVVIPDTTTIPGFSLLLYRSTNFGNTWTRLSSGITSNPGVVISKTKLVRSGLDSIYCFFQSGYSIYSWNIENNNFNPFPYTNHRDFDVDASSTGNLYIFIDSLGTNNIVRYGSTNGGSNWLGRGLITNGGAHPKVKFSGSGDTLILNYYGPVLADTATSIIRAARYRETTPGTMASAGFQDVALETVAKTEFKSVMYGGTVWFFYTMGTSGSIDINARVSISSGSTYGTAFPVAGNPNVDEYWFDANYNKSNNGGVDLVYFSDSLQSGLPTNNTDKIAYTYSNITNPNTFAAPTRISEHPPVWSPNGYNPVLAEFYDSPGDNGVIWVGLDGTAKRLYWDRYLLFTNITNTNTIAESYTLKQNYPNPFNPATKIEFSLPKDGFVTLKIYNMLGQEVRTIISQNLNNGSYNVDFNASQLSSGAYFYKLQVNDFSDIKKMIIQK